MTRGGYRQGSGRPTGLKNKKTLEREAARKVYEDLVRQNVKPLFDFQLSLARGVSYVYRIDRHGEGSKERVEHVLLESPQEIADALDVIANGDPNGEDGGNGFVYVTTKAPENRAIDSLLDRGIGKATQVLATEDDEGTRLPITGVIIMKDGADLSNKK